MRSRCSKSSVAVVVLSGLLVGSAFADQRADFALHVATAQQLYRAQDYAGAIRELDAAYQLRPAARVLFDLGMAHRKLGHRREALADFVRYRETRTRVDARVPIDRYIDELRAQLVAEEREAQAPVVEPPPVQPPAEPPPPESPPPRPPAFGVGWLTSRANPRPPIALTDHPPDAHRPIYKKAWFWIATVTGAAAIAVAIGVGVSEGGPRELSFQVHAK
jgi:hypothetical protein